METYVFTLVIGLLLAAVFVLIGVVISDAKNFYKGKSCFNHNHNALLDRDSNSGDSSVGDFHGEEYSGRDMGQGCYQGGKITPEAAVNALREISRGCRAILSNMERDSIEYAIDSIYVRQRLQTLVEKMEQERS